MNQITPGQQREYENYTERRRELDEEDTCEACRLPGILCACAPCVVCGTNNPLDMKNHCNRCMLIARHVRWIHGEELRSRVVLALAHLEDNDGDESAEAAHALLDCGRIGGKRHV